MTRSSKEWLKKGNPARMTQSSGPIYGLGLLGAFYYFWTTTLGFWATLLGVLKAFVWPAFAVYALFDFLKI